ncbi:tetratricopeptide repeat protein [Kitasatospora sp. NPDC059160]|uniref:tetratricopeptide repeat protein n=1 Tax=Kitasatospora sp. NPDC059160 TaxID=3346748 RepID=UPI003682EF23
METIRALWLEARQERDSEPTEEGNANVNYRERVDARTAAAINLSRFYARRGDKAKARDLLISELGRYRSFDGHLLAELYERFGWFEKEVQDRFGAALVDFIKNGEVEDLETVDACTWYAKRCMDRGNFERALAFAQQARLCNPMAPRGLEMHGEVLLAMGRSVEAEVVLLQEFEIRAMPHLYICRLSPLGKALKLNGRLRKLEELVRGAFENESREEYRNYRAEDLVEALILRGKLSEAEALQMSLVDKKRVDHYMDVFTLSRIIGMQGRRRDAISALQECEEYETGGSGYLKIEHANFLMRGGDEESAAKMLEPLLGLE